MNSQLHFFARAFYRSTLRGTSQQAARQTRFAQYVCRSCQSKFSTTAIRRAFGLSKKDAQNAAEVADRAGSKKYPSRLVIYDAGDIRTSFVSFWKATALFQFGVVGVFIAPVLYRNENQPDPNVRLMQAIGVGILGVVPMAMMSYLTSPFVKRIAIDIPAYAQISRPNLQRFASTIQPNARLEFTTLRAFPFQRTSTVLLHELRALPSQMFRFANLERVKTEASIKRWKGMPWYSKFMEIINEPRWKFYVKEGRQYTMKTGVPGVWEEIAQTIQRQSLKEQVGKGSAKPANTLAKLVNEPKVRPVRRQTARSAR
ncbi:hypothetical protein BU24DRAFT_418018 [Aaosphaeria arxii CBS 175.79]|uniref:Uncharacterized protein n=1 Tax=Aaosphaeria arxii CBS 175.79 TaxID=1450172 RepID=A0A6A5Y9W6_9PLEO|nr:uncharacterized protein BU24DRAFT_418018 [Aaosphaeria arxii CBS 175.79]KAF2022372.1 hypothetical protein BU24DRAFT_418018 [Aaosphaeria arxii CBS 175.79]